MVPTFDAADPEGVCSKLARAFRGSTETARQMIREDYSGKHTSSVPRVDCEMPLLKVQCVLTMLDVKLPRFKYRVHIDECIRAVQLRLSLANS